MKMWSKVLTVRRQKCENGVRQAKSYGIREWMWIHDFSVIYVLDGIKF